jgi:hypothetical protein
MHVEDRQESRRDPNHENATACFCLPSGTNSASKEIQAHYQASTFTVHRICASEVRIRSLSSPSNIDSQTERIVLSHYFFESFAFDASQEVEGFVTYNKVTKFGRTSEESWNQEHERIMMDKKPKRVDSGIRISDPRPIDDRQLHYTLETRTIVNELDTIIQEERDRRHHQAGVFRHVMHGSVSRYHWCSGIPSFAQSPLPSSCGVCGNAYLVLLINLLFLRHCSQVPRRY